MNILRRYESTEKSNQGNQNSSIALVSSHRSNSPTTQWLTFPNARCVSSSVTGGGTRISSTPAMRPVVALALARARQAASSIPSSMITKVRLSCRSFPCRSLVAIKYSSSVVK